MGSKLRTLKAIARKRYPKGDSQGRGGQFAPSEEIPAPVRALAGRVDKFIRDIDKPGQPKRQEFGVLGENYLHLENEKDYIGIPEIGVTTQGGGLGTALIDYIHARNPKPYTYVRNLVNPDLARSLERAGWQRVTGAKMDGAGNPEIHYRLSTTERSEISKLKFEREGSAVNRRQKPPSPKEEYVEPREESSQRLRGRGRLNSRRTPAGPSLIERLKNTPGWDDL